MTERMFPMMGGPPIPWSLAETIYEAYSDLFGIDQSLNRLADRGGFGWVEVTEIFNRLRRKNPDLYRRLVMLP